MNWEVLFYAIHYQCLCNRWQIMTSTHFFFLDVNFIYKRNYDFLRAKGLSIFTQELSHVRFGTSQRCHSSLKVLAYTLQKTCASYRIGWHINATCIGIILFILYVTAVLLHSFWKNVQRTSGISHGALHHILATQGQQLLTQCLWMATE